MRREKRHKIEIRQIKENEVAVKKGKRNCRERNCRESKSNNNYRKAKQK